MDYDRLWARLVAGDRQAFEDFCRQTWQDVYAFAYWRLQNHEEAEEVTQETYARLWAAAPRLRDEGSNPGGLLRTIAANIIRDGWRRRRTRGPTVPLDLSLEVPAPDETERSEHRMMVREGLAKLPPDQRRILELRLVEGYSVRETARVAGKTEASVRSLQYRGLRRLAEHLGLDRSGQVTKPGRDSSGGSDPTEKGPGRAAEGGVANE